ncbi:hypothetical protein IWX81_001627 [Salinibacterium sp. CAN_S4]
MPVPIRDDFLAHRDRKGVDPGYHLIGVDLSGLSR